MKHLKTPQELNEASENLNISDVSESKKITKDEFIDEFLDRLYMNGTKDDGKYNCLYLLL